MVYLHSYVYRWIQEVARVHVPEVLKKKMLLVYKIIDTAESCYKNSLKKLPTTECYNDINNIVTYIGHMSQDTKNRAEKYNNSGPSSNADFQLPLTSGLLAAQISSLHHFTRSAHFLFLLVDTLTSLIC